MTKQYGAGIASGIAGIILLAIAAWLIVVYSGAYNIAASAPHADVVRWTFETVGRPEKLTPSRPGEPTPLRT
ncbi:MAG TPA: hypothetical protein VIR38_07085 [Thalassobaculum sp.]